MPPATPPRPLRPAVGAALSALVAAAAFAGSVPSGFVYDDRQAVLTSPPVNGSAPLSSAFARDFWGRRADAAEGTVGTYRPLAVLSLGVDARLGGAPWLFHLTNVALHALVAAALFLALGTLAPASTVLAATLLFAVLAAPSEAVEAIVGRADLLAALGAVFGLYAHRRAGARWGVAAVALFALAIGAKESGALAPLAWLALDSVFPGERPRRRGRAAGYVGVALAYAGLRWSALGGAGPSLQAVTNPLVDAPVLGRVLGAARVFLTQYAAGIVDPFRRLYDCSARACMPAPASDWVAWAGLGALVGLFVAPLVLRRRAPLVAAGLGWFALFFAPASNLFVPSPTIYAERLLYLPLAGLALCAAVGVRALAAVAGARVAWVAYAGLLGLNLLAVQFRHGDWRSDERLFLSGLDYAEDSAVVHLNLAVTALDAGDRQTATREARRAVELFPRYPLAWWIVAVSAPPNEAEQARAAFARAAALGEHSAEFRRDYGDFLRRHPPPP